jgi:LacI family transcriptional regulator, fructose operon transcriptional repressor
MSHSIKDVALRAGCSIATVSRVLAGKGYISEDARQKVEAAVKELGYRPNRVARSLRAQKSRVIGLVLSDICNPFFSEISRAVERIAFLHGYNVLICNTDEDPQKEAHYLKLMDEEQVAGILLSPTRASAKSLDPSILPPVVLFDRKFPKASLDSVVIDNADLDRRRIPQNRRAVRCEKLHRQRANRGISIGVQRHRRPDGRGLSGAGV